MRETQVPSAESVFVHATNNLICDVRMYFASVLDAACLGDA